MATIGSREENTFIFETFREGANAFWIGGYQPVGSTEPDGGWAWITGECFNFENWSFGEPNNLSGNEAAIEMPVPSNGGWNDQDPNGRGFYYIVEFEPDQIPPLTVPGTSNPWLAGMPDGTPDYDGDATPANSPVLVEGLTLTPGMRLRFSACGGVSAHAGTTRYPPDGGPNVTSHRDGARYGISDINVPVDALVGVFLGPNQPDLSSAPPTPDFSTAASRDYATLSPTLQQVFFIGDGLTSSGTMQDIIVPFGATRLFLGTMDSNEWNNNDGSFSVRFNAVIPGCMPDTVPPQVVCNGNIIVEANEVIIPTLGTCTVTVYRQCEITVYDQCEITIYEKCGEVNGVPLFCPRTITYPCPRTIYYPCNPYTIGYPCPGTQEFVGANVTYSFEASDVCGIANIACTPPPGFFPLGATTVTCVASDLSANTNSCSFTVTVVPPNEPPGTPCERVELMIAAVQQSDLPRQHKRPLIATLEAACASFDRGNFTSGINQLQALKNKIEAQVTRNDPELADRLLGMIEEIIDSVASD